MERLDVASSTATVAVVVTTYNDAEFLREALTSVFTQHHLPSEVVVVDDGSVISPAPIVAQFRNAVLIQKQNGGPSSARNCGLQRVSSTFVLFLDADDRLRQNAISAGLDCFARSPAGAMVYGAHSRIAKDGAQLESNIYHPASSDPYADLLAGNSIGMLATVLYRRDILIALGGFDERLRRGEDYDLYLRLAEHHFITSHKQIVAEYRWHGGNTSGDTKPMLQDVLAVHDRHRVQTGARQLAWLAGRRNWKAWYTRGQRKHWDMNKPDDSSGSHIQRLGNAALKRLKRRLRYSWIHRTLARVRGTWPPILGSVRFGTLGTTRPISLDFGWDRGTPVDRYYVEQFLQRHAGEISGRVLEIGDDSYSRRFGGDQVTKQDILHRKPGHPKATLFGDLTQPGVLPPEIFDCIVLTQTLHLIFDLSAAASRLYAALRPGGVLLLTVPGISQIDRQEWAEEWCWGLTPTSLQKLFEPYFGRAFMTVGTHGNVFAATAFLQGVVLEEIERSKLDVCDKAYPVTVTLQAVKR